jgi:hypothetical protein
VICPLLKDGGGGEIEDCVVGREVKEDERFACCG